MDLSAKWTLDSPRIASSTVEAPVLPNFPSGKQFVVDTDGHGQAVARFVAPAPDPDKNRWHRVAKFDVEQGIVDGLWIDSLTFWGRLGEDTIITMSIQESPGSSKFVTVSRRVRDILRDDPMWRGLEDGARVSLTFTLNGTSPVNVLTLTQPDPVLMTVRLPDPGPHYTLKTATDPIVRNALIKLDGTKASILGYLVDYQDWTKKAGPMIESGPIVEVVVGKSGDIFGIADQPRRPDSAFGHTAGQRAQPESKSEKAMRVAAVSRGQSTVRLSPDMPKATGIVYEYVVRVVLEDGSTVDVLVGNDGRPMIMSGRLKLQPR